MRGAAAQVTVLRTFVKFPESLARFAARLGLIPSRGLADLSSLDRVSQRIPLRTGNKICPTRVEVLRVGEPRGLRGQQQQALELQQTLELRELQHRSGGDPRAVLVQAVLVLRTRSGVVAGTASRRLQGEEDAMARDHVAAEQRKEHEKQREEDAMARDHAAAEREQERAQELRALEQRLERERAFNIGTLERQKIKI